MWEFQVHTDRNYNTCWYVHGLRREDNEDGWVGKSIPCTGSNRIPPKVAADDP